MSFVNIDVTTPAGTDKIKFGDDKIREFKQQMVDNIGEISNYPASTMPATKTAKWTIATRPTGTELIDRVFGYNSDIQSYEHYDLASTSWIFPTARIRTWTVATRPTDIPDGYFGYCSDLNVIERYNGSAWVRIAGGRRGDIKMWSGSVSDIEAGWVFCDGVARTHPEGGTYTPPNLLDRFVVCAGSGYAVGAVGGEAAHTLTTNETPSHYHLQGFGSLSTLSPGPRYGQTNTGVNMFGDYYGGSPAQYPYAAHTSSVGGGAAHENRPPYYALCYLYKI